MASAFDKAVKGGIIRKETANRKKSRLTLRVNKVK
jgi:ribosomal protein S20